jgi:hypothetical protein
MRRLRHLNGPTNSGSSQINGGRASSVCAERAGRPARLQRLRRQNIGGQSIVRYGAFHVDAQMLLLSNSFSLRFACALLVAVVVVALA